VILIAALYNTLCHRGTIGAIAFKKIVWVAQKSLKSELTPQSHVGS